MSTDTKYPAHAMETKNRRQGRREGRGDTGASGFRLRRGVSRAQERGQVQYVVYWYVLFFFF